VLIAAERNSLLYMPVSSILGMCVLCIAERLWQCFCLLSMTWLAALARSGLLFASEMGVRENERHNHEQNGNDDDDDAAADDDDKGDEDGDTNNASTSSLLGCSRALVLSRYCQGVNAGHPQHKDGSGGGALAAAASAGLCLLCCVDF